MSRKTKRLVAILLIILGVLLVILGLTVEVRAQDYGCPMVVYKEYSCPGSNPWMECDPFSLYPEEVDERFCQMIVYISGEKEPFIRDVPGQICYPDPIWGGQHCMALYPTFAAAWSEDGAAEIKSVYVKSIKVGMMFLPLLSKELP